MKASDDRWLSEHGHTRGDIFRLFQVGSVACLRNRNGKNERRGDTRRARRRSLNDRFRIVDPSCLRGEHQR